MFEAIAIQKQFGEQVLFQQLSFQFPKQGLILLTGPSGSGKTTLLNIMQLRESYVGRLRFDGIELSLLKPKQQHEFRRLYLASVSQEVELVAHATVQDHLDIMKQLKGHFMRPHLKYALQQFLNEVKPEQTIMMLSRGQKQRLALFLACMGQTKILLLDEPTTGLDSYNRHRIYQLLHVMKKDQLIVMSSHQALEDGLEFDGHLHLAKYQNQRIQVDAKKAKLMPTSIFMKMPIGWFIQFQFRQRTFMQYRKRIHLFQTFIFSILGVMISLLMLVGKEVIRITDTMIGGQYQYVNSIASEEIELESTHATDSIFRSLPFAFELRSYYDEAYFEILKPYHRFYIENKGFELTLKDLHLGLINLTEKPPESIPPFYFMDLKEDDVMLGLQSYHLKLLAQTLDCFPTLNSINQVLAFSPLQVHLRINVPDWHYQDQIQFNLRRIELTDHPRWFHSIHDYPRTIYEERMRLPSKSLEEFYEFQPWRVTKTTLMQVEDHLALVRLWQIDQAWQSYHLQRHPLLGWQIYKSKLPRDRYPKFQSNEVNFHYHSKLGYHYFPNQKLSGFSHPLFFSPQPDGNTTYLDSLMQLKEPYDWLNVIPPKQSTIGYILANPGTSMKLKADSLLELNSIDEVVVSKNLITIWNLEIGDYVYVNHGIYPFLNENGKIIHTKQSMLKIVGTSEFDGNWIYHHPHWLSQWLMIEAGVPSHLLEPESWIFYDSVPTPIGYETLNPLKEVQNSINEILTMMLWILAIWFLVVGIPLLVLFFYYSIQSIITDQKQLKTLKGLGAPWLYIKHWYITKFMVLALEVIIPTIGVIILLDFLLKTWLGQYFYLSLRYQFPWESLTLFTLFSGVFYIVSTQVLLRVLKTNFQNY